MLDGAGVTNARALCSGEIAVVRRHGVAAIGRDGISVRGGPFGGRVTFANHDTDDLIVFSNDADGAGPSGHVSRAVLAVLGDRLGDASVQELDYPASQGFGATLLRDGGTLVLGNPTVLFDSSGGRSAVVRFDLDNVAPIVLGGAAQR
jgi:hypothetical protein